jgi:hypothetical protein
VARHTSRPALAGNRVRQHDIGLLVSEKYRQVLRQQDILIQQNLPPRNPPRTVNLP